MSWQGSARSLGMLLDKRAGPGHGEEKSQLEASCKFGLGWELFIFLAESLCVMLPAVAREVIPLAVWVQLALKNPEGEEGQQ